MSNKKLGLLLLPFVPLTAIGIVEVAGSIMPPKHEPVAVAPDCVLPAAPPVRRFAEPPPAPEPAMPRAVVST
jgi:hypothetical protein